MELKDSYIQSWSIVENKEQTKKHLALVLSNGIRSEVTLGNIGTLAGAEAASEAVRDELLVLLDGEGNVEVTEQPEYGKIAHTVYMKVGQYGAYGSFTKSYKYITYNFNKPQLSDAGKMEMATVKVSIDAENSLVIDLPDGRGARIINTTIVDGAPMLDANVIQDNALLFDTFGVNIDDFMAGTVEPHEANVVVLTKINRNGDKAYLEFGKVSN